MANATPGPRKSAVLAALDFDGLDDAENLISKLTTGSGSKRKAPSQATPGPSGKKRAAGTGRMNALAAGGIPRESFVRGSLCSMLNGHYTATSTQGGLPTHWSQEFAVNYDVETPVSNIDVGGPDQVERFVSHYLHPRYESIHGRYAMCNLRLSLKFVASPTFANPASPEWQNLLQKASTTLVMVLRLKTLSAI